MATQLLTYRYRLNPEKRQHRAFERILEQQRQIYNAALEERIEVYQKSLGSSVQIEWVPLEKPIRKANGKIITGYYGHRRKIAEPAQPPRTVTEVEQSRSLTKIRADDPTVGMVQRRIQRETLRRLDRAYKAFFRRVKQGTEAPGFPRFKGKEYFDGFGFDAFQQVKWDGKRLRFGGMQGGLRVHLDRPLPQVPDETTGELVTKIKCLWFKREGRRWYCGFQVEAPVEDERAEGKAIGVDWGTSVLAALSSGETLSNPRPGEALAKDVRRAQRAVSRKKKGSKRRIEARRHLAATQRKVANRRRNHLNKVSARLSKQFRFIAVENIDVKGLMDAERLGENLPEFVKTRRNREALDTAPYLLRQMLGYKATREGATLIAVDPAHTTPPCPKHGDVLSCKCDNRIERKIIAANTILQRALAHAAEDRGGPVPGGEAQASNGGNSLRRLGNTEDGQPPTGRRSHVELPLLPSNPKAARKHRQLQRPPPDG